MIGRWRNRSCSGEPEEPIWDAKTKKTMIITFVFLAAGLLFAWEFGKIHGEASEKPADATVREEKFWRQVNFLNPNYPAELRKDTIEMGWRACRKLEAGWEPTRVLSYLSQDSPATDAHKLPMPASQVLFWVGLEQSATLTLCPDQAAKLEGWMDDLEPKAVTIPETA